MTLIFASSPSHRMTKCPRRSTSSRPSASKPHSLAGSGGRIQRSFIAQSSPSDSRITRSTSGVAIAAAISGLDRFSQATLRVTGISAGRPCHTSWIGSMATPVQSSSAFSGGTPLRSSISTAGRPATRASDSVATSWPSTKTVQSPRRHAKSSPFSWRRVLPQSRTPPSPRVAGVTTHVEERSGSTGASTARSYPRVLTAVRVPGAGIWKAVHPSPWTGAPSTTILAGIVEALLKIPPCSTRSRADTRATRSASSSVSRSPPGTERNWSRPSRTALLAAHAAAER